MISAASWARSGSASRGRPARADRRGAADTGSAAIWVVSCCVLLMVVAAVLVLRSLAVLARHRVEAGADLSALAAAVQIGTSGRPCPAAAAVAGRNGVRLISCTAHLDAGGRSGVVVVRVSTSIRLPIVGAQTVTASARAARLAH